MALLVSTLAEYTSAAQSVTEVNVLIRLCGIDSIIFFLRHAANWYYFWLFFFISICTA